MIKKLTGVPGLSRAAKVGTMAGLAAALMLPLAACGSDSQAGDGMTEVRVGGTLGGSDVAFLVALERGYFEEEGLDVEMVPFKSASDMIAPLSAGELEVGGGAPSAGLYNALDRDLKLKIVGDKGTNVPGSGYFSLLVRKELVEKGEYKGLEDLEGLKIGFTGAGNTTQALVAAGLSSVGIDYNDAGVTEELLGFPDQVTALTNGSIDAGTVIEPFASRAVAEGVAVAYPGDEFYPNQQVAVVMYGEQFTSEEPDAAKAFMKAYVRAARDYNDALANGRFADTAEADAIIDILVEHTAEKDPEVYRSSGPAGLSPDGALNVDGMQQDFDFWKSQGLIEGDVSVEDAIDTSYYEAAVEELGAYEPAS